MMTLGRFRLSLVNHGFLRLDGGAMFGTVPKAIWSRVMPADEDNRVLLATRSLVIEADGRMFLADTGTGARWPEKFRRIYGLEAVPSGESRPDPERVTDVIITHLHFDHAGDIPSFPNARIHVQEANIETARRPNPRERASYPKEILDDLDRADVRIIRGSGELIPGLAVHRGDGHTRGLQWIEVRDGGSTVAFPSDMIPFSHHLALATTMGYDINAEKLLEEKAAFLERAAAEDWLVVFEHDPAVAAARVRKDASGRYAAGPAVVF